MGLHKRSNIMRISDLLSGHPPEALTFTVVTELVRNKERTLAKPSAALKEVQQKLKARLEELVGPVALSPIGNLLAHRGNRYVYQFDLQDAFPSVGAARLGARLFVLDDSLGTPKEVVAFVERYCLAGRAGLAQGAPASPILFEILATYWLDEPIGRLLGGLEARGFAPVRYTRYVDDLTFSSQEEIGDHVRYKLREVVRKAGFRINDKKAARLDLSQNVATITGGKLRYKKTPVLLDSFYQKLERQLEHLERNGLTSVAAQSLKGNIAWLRGLERHTTGSTRNRDIRRILGRVAVAEAALAELKEERAASRKRARKLFSKQWLERLRNTADIVSYVHKCLPYDWAPMARSIKCPCPFCGLGRRVAIGRRTRQTLTVSPKRQSFHCYNPHCKAHGDIIQFAQELFGWDFVTAVVEIAREANVSLPPEYVAKHGAPTYMVPVQLELLGKK